MLYVHEQEAGCRDLHRAGQGDHPGGQVYADDLAVRRHHLRQSPAQGSRSASKIQDSHAGSGRDELERAPAAGGFAAGHDVLEAALIGESVAAEDRGEQLLGLHASSVFHRFSSHAAAPIAALLVRPTTWMPTGSPRTGAGSVTTGWPVVLKGRV